MKWIVDRYVVTVLDEPRFVIGCGELTIKLDTRPQSSFGAGSDIETARV